MMLKLADKMALGPPALMAAVCLIVSGANLVTFCSSAPTECQQNCSSQLARAPLQLDTTDRRPAPDELQRPRREPTERLKKKEKKDKEKEKEKGGHKRLLAECLAAHNKFRREHGVPGLQWDDKIAEFAQKRSNHIAASDGAEFGHPPDLPFGENLFWHSSVETACEKMVRGWYDEIELYDFKAPTFAPATGHFTQLIWRNTNKVGCAFATSSGTRGGVYLTCNYDPPGNFVGEFPDNVPRVLAPSDPLAQSEGSSNRSTPTSPPRVPGLMLTTTKKARAQKTTTTRKPLVAVPNKLTTKLPVTSTTLASLSGNTTTSLTTTSGGSNAETDERQKQESRKKKGKKKKKKDKKKKDKKKKKKKKKKTAEIEALPTNATTTTATTTTVRPVALRS